VSESTTDVTVTSHNNGGDSLSSSHMFK